MEYPKGYVYELMEQGGPTNVMEPYFILIHLNRKNKNSPRYSHLTVSWGFSFNSSLPLK